MLPLSSWLLPSLPLLGLASFPAQDLPAPPPGTRALLDWGDYDGDEYEDILAIRPNGTVSLLRNLGDGNFSDETVRAGLDGVQGVTFSLWHDVTGDERADLLLGTASGPTLLFENQDGGFSNVATRLGIDATGADRSARWLDYDHDGTLDLHLDQASGSLFFHGLEGGGFERIPVDLVLRGAMTGAVPAPQPQTAIPSTPPSPLGHTASQSYPSGGASPMPSGSSSPGIPIGASFGGTVTQTFRTLAQCVKSIEDALGGDCIQASATATLGMLYPLSDRLFVEEATGFVGVGTLTPMGPLDVRGAAFLGGEPTDSHFEFAEDRIQQRNGSTPATMNLNAAGGHVAVSADAPGFGLGVGRAPESGFRLDVAGPSRIDQSLRISNPTATAVLELAGSFANAFLDRADATRESLVRFRTGIVDDWLIGTDNFPAAGANSFSIKSGPNIDPEFVIDPAGNVGVGVTEPAAKLQVSGMIRLGSETGTGQTPDQGFTYTGMVLRRLFSNTTSAGEVVARSSGLRLERDGSNGGFQLAWDANPLPNLAAYGTALTQGGTVVPIVINIGAPTSAGTQPVYTETDVVRLDLAFGLVFNTRDITEVTLMRDTGDSWWVGSVISTFDQ